MATNVYSPLTARTVATKKKSSRNGRTVERLIIHHTAGGTNESNVTLLSVGARKVSASYVLQTTGALVGIVPENYRPWTTGSFSADGPAVTVETVNSSGAPDWKVTDAQLETLAQLAADLSTRYGWGRLDRSRVMGHREFASTSCPGPYLWPRLDDIVARANQILDGAETKPSTAPAKPAPGLPATGAEGAPSRADIERWAAEVIAGKHGTGHDNRRRSLQVSADVYAQVRAEVNRRVYGAPAPKPRPSKADIVRMAQEVIDGKHGTGHANRQRSLGVSTSTYQQVRDEVNRRISGKTTKPAKSISQMATEVIAGKHGTGHEARRRSLGIDAATYAKVRAEVNRRV